MLINQSRIVLKRIAFDAHHSAAARPALDGVQRLGYAGQPAHGCTLCHGVADVVISAHTRAPTPTHTHTQPAGTVGCVELEGSHE